MYLFNIYLTIYYIYLPCCQYLYWFPSYLSMVYLYWFPSYLSMVYLYWLPSYLSIPVLVPILPIYGIHYLSIYYFISTFMNSCCPCIYWFFYLSILFIIYLTIIIYLSNYLLSIYLSIIIYLPS